jgi:hypothetical protein
MEPVLVRHVRGRPCHRRRPTNPALPVPWDRGGGGGGGGGGWLAALKRRMPASWSPAVKNVVLTGGAGVALVGVLVTIVGVGPVVFTLSAVVLVLVFLLILVGVGL